MGAAGLRRMVRSNREAMLAGRRRPFRESLRPADDERLHAIAANLDEKGRFVEDGSVRPPTYGQPFIKARVIQCQTFIKNLKELTRYVVLSSAL
jgi:hypothetical protein